MEKDREESKERAMQGKEITTGQTIVEPGETVEQFIQRKWKWSFKLWYRWIRGFLFQRNCGTMFGGWQGSKIASTPVSSLGYLFCPLGRKVNNYHFQGTFRPRDARFCKHHDYNVHDPHVNTKAASYNWPRNELRHSGQDYIIHIPDSRPPKPSKWRVWWNPI